MNNSTWRLVKIARKLKSSDPLLSYELENRVRALYSVVNPGASRFDKNLEAMMTVLKSLKQELEDALDKLGNDPDAEEFAKFFDDVAEAEQEELRRLLDKVRTSSRTAGPKDWMKRLFKKSPEVEESGASYDLDDLTLDEIVEGRRDWADPGHYVGLERGQNQEFLSNVESILKEVDGVKNDPSKSRIESILKTLNRLINRGGALLKGMRDHLLEPSQKGDFTDKGYESGKSETKRDKLLPERLENVIVHYSDMLKESAGDELKTIKYLKELFNEVRPLVEEERAQLASYNTRISGLLIRVAYSNPGLRPGLLPVIKRLGV